MSNHDLLSVMHSFGLEVNRLETGGLMRCKAIDDKGAQRSGWYRFFDDIDAQVCVFGNWRTGERNTWAGGNQHPTATQRQAIQAKIDMARIERQQEQRQRQAANAVKNKRLWNESLPIGTDTPVARYLVSRGLFVPTTPCLRYHPSLSYWHDGKKLGTFPAMLAAVTNPSNELITVHRTYLTLEGGKPKLPTVKKLCATSGPMSGSTIKLSAPALNDGVEAIGIAEGIETALAAQMLFGVPVWAGVSAHGLKAFTPPPTVKSIYIFADNDISNTGQQAAKELAERLTLAGRTVRIHTPPSVGDWADELLKIKGMM